MASVPNQSPAWGEPQNLESMSFPMSAPKQKRTPRFQELLKAKAVAESAQPTTLSTPCSPRPNHLDEAFQQLSSADTVFNRSFVTLSFAGARHDKPEAVAVKHEEPKFGGYESVDPVIAPDFTMPAVDDEQIRQLQVAREYRASVAERIANMFASSQGGAGGQTYGDAGNHPNSYLSAPVNWASPMLPAHYLSPQTQYIAAPYVQLPTPPATLPTSPVRAWQARPSREEEPVIQIKVEEDVEPLVSTGDNSSLNPFQHITSTYGLTPRTPNSMFSTEEMLPSSTSTTRSFTPLPAPLTPLEAIRSDQSPRIRSGSNGLTPYAAGQRDFGRASLPCHQRTPSLPKAHVSPGASTSSLRSSIGDHHPNVSRDMAALPAMNGQGRLPTGPKYTMMSSGDMNGGHSQIIYGDMGESANGSLGGGGSVDGGNLANLGNGGGSGDGNGSGDQGNGDEDQGRGGGRGKKLSLACHFCRRRKLKCDGSRPTCDNCMKRGEVCTFDDNVRRRGPGKRTKEMRDRAQAEAEAAGLTNEHSAGGGGGAGPSSITVPVTPASQTHIMHHHQQPSLIPTQVSFTHDDDDDLPLDPALYDEHVSGDIPSALLAIGELTSVSGQPGTLAEADVDDLAGLDGPLGGGGGVGGGHKRKSEGGFEEQGDKRIKGEHGFGGIGDGQSGDQHGLNGL